MLHLPLLAIPPLRRRGAVAIPAHTRTRPPTDKIRCRWDTRRSALPASVVLMWCQEASGAAMLAIVFVSMIVSGAVLADVRMHGLIALGMGMFM